MKRTISTIANSAGLQPRGGFLPVDSMEVASISDDSDFSAKVEKLAKKSTMPDAMMAQCLDYMIKIYVNAVLSFEGMNPVHIMSTLRSARSGATKANKREEFMQAFTGLREEMLNRNRPMDYKKVLQLLSENSEYEAVAHAGKVFKNSNYKVTKADAELFEYISRSSLLHFCLLNHRTAPNFFLGTKAKNVAPSACDIATDFVLYELKYTKSEPTSKHTFQLLLYYIVGLHEHTQAFWRIHQLEVVNLRLGKAYIIRTDQITDETIKTIEKDILGYSSSIVD